MPLGVLESLFRFALLAAFTGHWGTPELWFSFAVALRMGWFGMLRPKEIFNILVREVRLPRSSWGPRVAVIRIREAKNRNFMGRLQVSLIRDGCTVLWLSWLVARLPGDGRVWFGSPAQFPKCLVEALAFYGFEKLVSLLGLCVRDGALICLSRVLVWQLSDTPVDGLANVLFRPTFRRPKQL